LVKLEHFTEHSNIANTVTRTQDGAFPPAKPFLIPGDQRRRGRHPVSARATPLYSTIVS